MSSRNSGAGARRWGACWTAVHRDLKADDPLAALLARNALTFAADSILRFSGGQFQVRPYAGFTFVNGEPGAIARIQRSSAHYLQRPDKDYWLYDPSRTSINGSKSGIEVERSGGQHWLGSTSFEVETPGFESNDIGRTLTADGLRHVASLRYRETQPGRIFRAYSLLLNVNNEWNYDKHLAVRSLPAVGERDAEQFLDGQRRYHAKSPRRGSRPDAGRPADGTARRVECHRRA